MDTPIPQPPGSFLTGNLRDLEPDHSIESMQRLQKLYGGIFCLKMLRQRMVIISSQEIVNHLCDESKFDKKLGAAIIELRAAMGDGLFTAETTEPNWKLAHKILMPVFGPQAIRDMFPKMMDVATQLILRWERFAGQEIDVCDNFTRLTLDTIALCSFNYRFNSFYHDTLHEFVQAMVDVLVESGRRVKRLNIQNKLMFTTNRQYHDNVARLHSLCDEIIQQRREHPENTNDLLDRMINGKDPDTGYQLSDENIRYQMVTFLIAGHETTSGLLSFTVYYLLKNPECLQKAQAEVDQFDEITVDTLGKLKYIDAVFKETLRLQPTAPAFTRKTLEDEAVLPGGYRVYKDDALFVLISGLHRDPNVWENPEEFNPERMLNGGYEKLPPNAWKPFGNGQRACIGRPFAWQEALLALALVLKYFNLELVDPSYDLRLKETLTIKPEDLKIRVRSRRSIPITLSGKSEPVTSRASEPAADITSHKKDLKPMAVLFGSNSGSCESFARTIAAEAPIYGYHANVKTLDSSVGNIPTDCPVIIVTASYEGKPCENAKQFVAYLESKPSLPISYAVFGAGHRDWVSTYQKVPIFIDQTLEQIGGTRIIERGETDVSGDFYGAFESWKENLFRTLTKDSPQPNLENGEKLSIEILHSSRSLGQINSTGKILENRVLVQGNDELPTFRHVEIELPKGQTYRAGDYLAVLPTNPMEIVSRVLRRFNLTTDTYVRITSTMETFLPTNHPISAFEILSGYVELSQPISKKQLEKLIELNSNDDEKSRLQSLVDESYESKVLMKRVSILDILEMYPACELTFSEYLRMLPCLRVRQYSISSSPLWNPEVVTLTLDVLRAPALSGCGQYYGVASNYLANLNANDRLSCSVRASNVRFHPPDNPKTSIIMIAAGSGIAPFRGFIQERAAQFTCGREVGKTILYYGCRYETDFLYADELKRWSNLGAVQAKTVFSRQGDGTKKYVQDLLWEDRQDIGELYKQGCHFYTCGSASKLGKSVKICFTKILAEIHQCDHEEASRIFDQISQDRFNIDVFA